MPSSKLIRRLLGRSPARGAPYRASRIEVRPPAVWGQAESVWVSLWDWLRQSDGASERPLRILDEARSDFCAALKDLDGAPASDLLRRGEHARSLRELWHLRAELYSLVARHLNQAEADRRVGLLNRHFPIGTASAAPAPASARTKHDHLA
ncbi:MAG TPA: hypothetical protein VLA16_25875 [Ideonella sp.]|nr:hypothetical protein [Ideonella sp.]